MSSAKIVVACVQNQVKDETTVSSRASSQESEAPAAMVNVAPIRPIRVPEKLHHIIKQAIAQHAQGQ